jgi:alcohol dehydrogenase class IV
MPNKLKINLDIIHGKDSLKTLNLNLKNLNFKNPYLICDKILENNKYINKNILFLKKKIFLKFDTEPTYEQLDIEIKKIKKIKKIDCFIGIGGGSALDFTKGIAILYANNGPSLKYMGFPQLKNKPLPVILVPSTASTGSEIIYNAVFTHEKTKKKLGINSSQNYPILSILDPRLISFAPKRIIYQSAIATLMRSIETFTSKDATFLTKIFSINAFEILVKAFSKKRSHNFFEDCQLATMFSMIALSNSSSGPCGVINYYLSSNFKIAQSLSYNFTAFEFLKNNILRGYSGYAELLKNFKEYQNTSEKKKTYIFLNLIKKILYLNLNSINKAKKIISKEKNFTKNIFKAFAATNFLALKKNPIFMGPNHLRQIIKNIPILYKF